MGSEIVSLGGEKIRHQVVPDVPESCKEGRRIISLSNAKPGLGKTRRTGFTLVLQPGHLVLGRSAVAGAVCSKT
jgi:hypothetical protein